MSRDPLEAHVNLHGYVADNPVLYTDPTGRDIYLAKGQRGEWDPLHVIYQDIAVDKWKKDANGCWVKNGIASFSFGITGRKKHYPLQRSWLGWSDGFALKVIGVHFGGWRLVLDLGLRAGKHREGVIYESTFDPRLVISRLETTPEQDIEWLEYMEDKRLRTRDRYTVFWNNCVNYTNHEFEDAMNRFPEAEHKLAPGVGPGPWGAP